MTLFTDCFDDIDGIDEGATMSVLVVLVVVVLAVVVVQKTTTTTWRQHGDFSKSSARVASRAQPQTELQAHDDCS